MKEAGREIFYVRMLGEFSITCEGKEIILGRKSTAKFIQLLQFVWLRGRKGVTQMVKIGLPKGEYISRVNGVYVPDPEFPVKLDVHEFEDLVLRAERSKDEQVKLACYQAAVGLYRGELLPAVCTEIWVMAENLRLKSMFEICVQWLGDYYRKESDYNALDYLFGHAVRLYPYDNWQINQIEVLLDKGEYKNANDLYNEMTSRYSEEMGLAPTPEMMKCYERISQMTLHFSEEMSEIKRKIWEYPGEMAEGQGAYYCSYSSFVDICHMLSRNMERTERSIYMMLCTLVDYEGKMIRNQEKLKMRAAFLKEVINGCLRKGDVYTQYSNAQFLILLVGTKRKDCYTWNCRSSVNGMM